MREGQINIDHLERYMAHAANGIDLIGADNFLRRRVVILHQLQG